MNEHKWSTEWPTLPGRYWFYGRRSTLDKEDSLHTVEVIETRNGFIYMTGGAFLYNSQGTEGAQGQWYPLPTPALPTMKGEG